MKEYECYLFDADGTLFDTSELIYQCFLYTCRKYGNFTINKEKVYSKIGLPLNTQIKSYLGNMTEEKIKEVSSSHMEYQLSIYDKYLKLFNGISETVDLLKKNGKKTGIVTSRKKYTLEKYLRHTDIYSYFDILVTPELTRKHKPDPDPVLKALDITGSFARETIFIGDASYDIESGDAAGTDTAFVMWSRNSPSVCRVKPTYLIRDMKEMVSYLS